MNISVIGAGNIGGNLTRRLTALGHDVKVANSRGPETLAQLESESGATAVAADEAARGAEVIVVTIPERRIPDLPQDILAGAADGAVVIDTGNYYPQQRDGRIDEIEQGMPESRWVASAARAPCGEGLQQHLRAASAREGRAGGSTRAHRAARGR